MSSGTTCLVHCLCPCSLNPDKSESIICYRQASSLSFHFHTVNVAGTMVPLTDHIKHVNPLTAELIYLTPFTECALLINRPTSMTWLDLMEKLN